ncbi:MAG: hypothetical protein IKL97_04200 [Eggerthellaceae bacterium]|nr:hypothetical protein [Eggerthellaceae bacterium]
MTDLNAYLSKRGISAQQMEAARKHTKAIIERPPKAACRRYSKHSHGILAFLPLKRKTGQCQIIFKIKLDQNWTKTANLQPLKRKTGQRKNGR